MTAKHFPTARIICTAALVLFATAAIAQDAEYVGHTQCKICHNKKPEGEQWNKRNEAEHSQAFELLKSDEAKAVAQKLGMTVAPSESPDCLKCHVTGYDVEKRLRRRKLTRRTASSARLATARRLFI